jgi:hypothetical protein
MTDYGIAIIELKPDINFDPRTGYSIVRRWKGTEYQIDLLATFYEFRGFRVERNSSDNGGKSFLRVYFGALETWPVDQPLIDKWSKRGNDLEKRLWELPKVKAETNKVTAVGDLALLKSDVEALVTGRPNDAVDTDGNPIRVNGKTQKANLTYILGRCTAIGMNATVLEGLIGAFARGEEAFLVSQCVLTRTVIAPFNTTIEADETNVDKIFTTSGMKTLFPTIPNKIRNQMREGFWLKKTPTEDQTASDRITIEYEWWFAELYDTYIYGNPIQ